MTNLLDRVALELTDPLGQWQPYLCDAREVSITRGGSRKGVLPAIDVGTLSVTFVNAADPDDDVNIRPNTGVRVRQIGREVEVYSLAYSDHANKAAWAVSAESSKWTVGVGSISGSTLVFGNGGWAATGYFVTYPDAPAPLRVQRMLHGLTVGALYRVDVVTRYNGSRGATFGLSVPGGTEFGVLPMHATNTSGVASTGTFRATAASLPLWISQPTTQFIELLSIRVTRLDSPATPVFTGKVQDVAITSDKDGNQFVHLVATDAVQSHANITRYGAVTEGGALFEPWSARISRLSGSALAPVATPPANPKRTIYTQVNTAELDGWRRFGTAPSGIELDPLVGGTWFGGSIWHQTKHSTTPVTQAAGVYGVERTITGLTPGAIYTVDGKFCSGWAAPGGEPDQYADQYAIGVAGIGWGAAVEGNNNLTAFAPFTFTATSTSHTVRVSLAETTTRTTLTGVFEFLFVRGVTVVENSTDPYVLQDTAYESSLASHFDLACNSVGARWWVDRDNVTQFRRWDNKEPVAIQFGDTHLSPAGFGNFNEAMVGLTMADFDALWAGKTFADFNTYWSAQGFRDTLHACVNDVQVSYDTRSVVNDLDVANHGRDATTGNTLDVTSKYSNESSVAAWGPRRSTLDVSLYTGGTHASDVLKRSLDLFGVADTAERFPTRVRFNATDHAALMPDLDVHTRVTVRRKGAVYTCRVLGIEHEITPDGWHINLELAKDTAA